MRGLHRLLRHGAIGVGAVVLLIALHALAGYLIYALTR